MRLQVVLPLTRTIPLLLVALLLVPSPASAAAPIETHDTVLAVVCPRITTADGTFELGLSVPANREPDASLGYWPSDRNPDVDPPLLLGFPSLSLRQSSPTTIDGALDIVPLDGSEPFLAPIAVELAPAGPATSFTVEDRFGNVTTRMTFSTEPMEVVSGSVTLGDGPTFDLLGCAATRGTADIWQTAPTASVIDGEEINITCTWSSADVFAVLVIQQTPFDSQAVLHAETTAGIWDGAGDPAIGETAITAELDLVGTGAGRAAVGLGVEPGPSRTYVQRFRDTRTRVTDTILALSGSVTLFPEGGAPIVLGLEDAACDALHSEFHGAQRSTSAAAHRAPDNDTLAGAIDLPPGGTVSVHTEGTVLEGEAPSECLKVDGEFDPFVHTVWYRFTGTGARTTIDTRGSDFDTGVAVYLPTQAGLEEIACSNTVFLDPVGATLQGRVTFDTALGVTYYLQAGGYIDEAGHLIVRLDVDQGGDGASP